MTPEQIYEMAPYVRTLGIELGAMSPEEVRARLEWAPQLTTVGGGLHGGTLMALPTRPALCAPS